MPAFIHDRARHIQAKNPEMPESQAFAIATQQSHALGKTPKSYGTAEGRREAKAKYDTPKDDKKTADPGGIGSKFEKTKEAEIVFLRPFVDSLTDELHKIAQEAAGQSDVANPAQLGVVKSTTPKSTVKPGMIAKYAPVNSGNSTSPLTQHQPVLSAPPVRT